MATVAATLVATTTTAAGVVATATALRGCPNSNTTFLVMNSVDAGRLAVQHESISTSRVVAVGLVLEARAFVGGGSVVAGRGRVVVTREAGDVVSVEEAAADGGGGS